MAAVIDRLKAQPWFEHLLRAFARFNTRLGSQFAGAITYFSVLAVIPILMFAFSIAGFVLTVARPDLLYPLATRVADSLGQADAATRDKILALIGNALSNYTSIGVVGLLSALYSGAGWMGNLKNAFRAQARPQFDLQEAQGNIVRKTLVNLVTLVGLIVLIVITFGLASLSTTLSGTVVRWLGLGDVGWLSPVLTFVPIVFSIGAGWLLFVYLFRVLPEEHERRAVVRRGALIGAIGLAVLQYLASFLIGRFAGNQAFAIFGPVIALMLFFNLFAQLILFTAAWVGTADHEAVEPVQESVRFVVAEEGAAVSEAGAVVPQDVAARSVQVGIGAGYVTGAATGAGLGAALAYVLTKRLRR